MLAPTPSARLMESTTYAIGSFYVRRKKFPHPVRLHHQLYLVHLYLKRIRRLPLPFRFEEVKEDASPPSVSRIEVSSLRSRNLGEMSEYQARLISIRQPMLGLAAACLSTSRISTPQLIPSINKKRGPLSSSVCIWPFSRSHVLCYLDFELFIILPSD